MNKGENTKANNKALIMASTSKDSPQVVQSTMNDLE